MAVGGSSPIRSQIFDRGASSASRTPAPTSSLRSRTCLLSSAWASKRSTSSTLADSLGGQRVRCSSWFRRSRKHDPPPLPPGCRATTLPAEDFSGEVASALASLLAKTDPPLRSVGWLLALGKNTLLPQRQTRQGRPTSALRALRARMPKDHPARLRRG
jgi:hypothetical protein